MCCGQAGEKEKESMRGTMGRGKREERLPLPIVPRMLTIFLIIAIFLKGYPAGASVEERATDVD